MINQVKVILATVIITGGLFSAPAVTSLSGPIINPANSHAYYLLSSDSWTASELFAQSLGGNLVTINNLSENSWVRSTFFPLVPSTPQTPALWIGLTDKVTEGNFLWASGESVSYLNWAGGEPNNTSNPDPTGEDYAAMRAADGAWNDLPTAGGGVAGSIFGVAEVVPEPQMVQLSIFGLMALLGKRCFNKQRAS